MWKNKKSVATKLSKHCLLENSLIELAEQDAWLEYLDELKKRNIYKEERSLVACKKVKFHLGGIWPFLFFLTDPLFLWCSGC